MKRYLPLDIDHIGWGCMEIYRALDDFNKLGFIMIDPPPSADVFHMCHYFMDHGRAYVELYGLTRDGKMWADRATQDKVAYDPMGHTGVYSFVLSTKDIDETRKAAMAAGFSAGPVYRGPRQNGTYPSVGGASAKGIFQFEMSQLPFPNAFFAVMEHLDEHLTHYYRRTAHTYHDNGVTGISSAALYYKTPEDVLFAQKEFNRLHDAVSPYSERGYCTDHIFLVDKEGYEKEFGVDAPEMVSPVVAVEFEHGDLGYIEGCAKKNGMKHFTRDDKLYVDCRANTSTFLVFK